MSKVNYYLKGVPKECFLDKLKKENRKLYSKELLLERPVVLSVAHQGKREIISTGKSIPLRYWDKVAKRVKNLLDTPAVVTKNGEWLDAKKLELEKHLQVAQSEYRPIDKYDLYELVNRGVRTRNEINSLSEVLKLFFINHKTSKGVSLKKNTLKKYTSLINHMTSFQGDNQFIPQRYSTLWVKNFKEFLMFKVRLNDNTVCKYIIALKTFFSHLKLSSIIIPATLSEIKVSETEQIVNILKKDELSILENIELNNSNEKVRDVFLFQCYTGARYSDIYIAKKQDIYSTNGIKVWDYIDEKTGSKIKAPISNRADKILQKYIDLPTPLPRITNQAMNRELKKIAKLAELDRLIKLVSYNDNIKKESTYFLYEKISTHMARKTFISLTLQSGIQERMVRTISNHKDERSFKKYINLDNTHLVAVAEVWNNMGKK